MSDMRAHRAVRALHRPGHRRRKFAVKPRWKAPLPRGRIEEPVENQYLFAFDRSSQERIAGKFGDTQVEMHVVSVDGIKEFLVTVRAGPIQIGRASCRERV